MAYQSQSNAVVAYKVQTGLGVPASGAAGTVLRVSGGTGGQLTKAATESAEVRNDGMRIRGRHGIQKTTASWNAEASIGSWEPIAEAIMRDTWAAPLVVTEITAGLTSITTTANTIVATAGSWITAGLRVGDVIVLTNHVTPGNNSRNLRITGLTATVITVAELLTLNATPDTAFTVTRPGKKLIQSGTLVKRYFTIDEFESDIDQSQTMADFVWGSMRFGMAPNGLLTFDPGGMGTGQLTALATGASSPLLTAPVATTGLPLSVVDATVRINGVDQVALSSLDITIDITPMAPDVFGSGAIKYAPDVFTGQMGIGINFTALRSDLQMLQDFAAETQYSIHLLAVENEVEPKDFLSIYIGNLTLGGVTKSAYSKDGGPRTQTIAVPMALIGRDVTGTANDATMIKFQSTAP